MRLADKSWYPWLVVFSAALFFFYEFIQMNMFNTINPFLMHEFSITATQMGYVTAAYFYADVIFLFPAGMLLDRFSTRKIILWAMLLCIISTVVMARAHSITTVAICHFIAGIGNAFCFLSCARLASRWFPPRRMALVIGLIVTMAFLGGMVAQAPLNWLISKVSWRQGLIDTAGLGTLIMLIVYLWVQDYPKNTQAAHLQEQHKLKSLGLWHSMWQALANRQNWLCGFYTSFMNLPLMVLGGAWGKMYLQATTSLTSMQTSYIPMMLFFGSMLGCPLLGWMSDRLMLRRLPMVLFAILSIPVILIITNGNLQSFTPLLIIFFLLGFVTAAQTIAYPAIAEYNPKALTSTAMGLASVLIMGGPAVFDPLFGWIMDRHAIQKSVYSAADFHAAMLTLPVMLIVAIIVGCLIIETRAKQLAE